MNLNAETEQVDPEFDFMMNCNKEQCLFFCDCFSDEKFNWKKCFIVKTGGFITGSEEERRVYWNAMRDINTRGTYDEVF